MSYSTIGVVTGANKGIGLAIVRQLALRYPGTEPDGRMLVYLTSRDTARGEAALASLQSDEALKKAKALGEDGGMTDVRFRQLDIIHSGSIQALVEDLEGVHGKGGLDFVVNNAGIAMDGFNENVVKTTIKCNYYGTLKTTRAFLPLLKPHGRIINVASSSGSLSSYRPALAARFRASRSVSNVSMLMEEFVDAACRGKEADEGWPSAAYGVSKAGVIGVTRALAEEVKGEEGGEEKEVVSCHPGYVNTDMTKGRGVRTPDEGAETPVLLALGLVRGPSGGYWVDGREVEW